MSEITPTEDILDPKGAKHLVKRLKKTGHKAKYLGSVFGYMIRHDPQDQEVTVITVRDQNNQVSIVPGYRRLVERAIKDYGNKALVRFIVIRLNEHSEFVCGIAGS